MARAKAVAATGMIGTGFLEESLVAASVGADVIACDGGSSDPGPYYLGSGEPQFAPGAIRHDVERMLAVALERNIPLILGSAGTAGGDPHVAIVESIVRDIAASRGWHFSLATIRSEVSADKIVRAFERGQITPLAAAPAITSESIYGSSRIVAMMGVEPIQRALREGAQVVLTGRSSDVSIFAAVPLALGIPPGVAYHAGKIIECGAASASHRLYPDGIAATMDEAGFTVEPPNPDFRCTPQSVASHTLYENANPFRLVEPGGVLDTASCTYEQSGPRAVLVRGSKFEPNPDYTVRLEAATLAGYRAISVAGIRDPLVLRQLDSFLERVEGAAVAKVNARLGLDRSEYSLRWRTYGADGTLGALEPTPAPCHEVGLVIDVVAKTQESANAVLEAAWYTALHHPIAEYSGGVSHLAFPFSPPALPAGPVYEFSLNHVWHLDDPCSPFPATYQEL